MRYIPSPILLQYRHLYSATANKSGRMQYHRVTPGVSKTRIGRAEFIRAYNTLSILALRPLRTPSVEGEFQIEFYV